MFRRVGILACVALVSFLLVNQVDAQDPDILAPIESINLDPDEEALLAIFDQFHGEILNTHDMEGILSFFAEDAVFDYVPSPPPLEGREAIGAFFESVFQAFPDWKCCPEVPRRKLISGNIVVVECTVVGTQEAEWSGIPATGRSVQTIHLDICEYEGDEIKRLTTYDDAVSMMVQLGLMPAPEPLELVPSATPPDPEAPGLPPLEAAENIAAVWNTGDLNNYMKLIHSDAEVLIAPLGATLDRNAFMAAEELYFATYPDLQQEIVRMVDMEDGWVLTEVVFAGTNDGPYYGLPPTGNAAAVRGVWLARFDTDGLMTYMAVYWDELTTMAQLGLFPPLPPLPEFPPIPEFLVQDQITSPSLEGNLLGDTATRDVLVYLPPSYETSPDKSYPTIYVLHGFTGDHRMFVGAMNAAMQSLTGIDLGIRLEDIIAELLATGGMGETIIVIPDGSNVYGGGWYERSEVLGDYRDYIARDLVGYIDGKYRTIPDREHRAVTGHSMGGYGALSLAIEYNDVFGAVAALSPGGDIEASPTAIENFIEENPETLGEPILISSDEDLWRMYLTKFSTNVLYSLAAAYSPNPDNPPYYVDLPVQYPDKTTVQDVWDKWKERSLVSQIERDGSNLSDTAIFIDQGVGETMIMAEGPGLAGTLAALDAQGIPYTYDEFPGDHVTHLRYQLASALAFLSPRIGATPPPPDTEANKAVAVRDFEEIWNQGNLDVVDEIVASDIVIHVPPEPDIVGAEAYKGMVAMYRAAFPDMQWIIEDITAQGDMVAVRLTATGTHQGEFMGIPPTGVQITGTLIAIMRIVDGKQVESWNYADFLGFMQQIGVITPGRPVPENYMWGAPSEVTGDPGTPEANEALITRLIDEFWNQGNLDTASELLSDDLVSHNPPISAMYPSTVDGLKQYATDVSAAFPDFQVVLDDLILEGDRAVGHWTATGTHEGEFLGIPATGRHASVPGVTIYRFAENKIVEMWWAWDAMGLMQKLTAPPPKYEVYALMVSVFEDGGPIFRFADESRPDVYAKNREDAPINCIYVRGPGVELIYGPGPSREAMDMLGMPYYGHEEMLSKIGVSLDQINYVVIDHTCFDHPGGVDLFPNATVIVQNALFDQPNPLVFPMPDGSMFPLPLEQDYAKLEQIREEGRLLVVEGDYEIAPGLTTHHAPGHTYETNFLTIDTEDGTVVAAGDTCYTYLNLKYDIPPVEALMVDSEAMLQGYEKIRQAIGDSDALLVPGHEMDVYKRYTQVADRVVKIELPKGDFTNVFFTQLDPGLNMISLPLKPMFQHDARSFAEMLGATMVVRYDSDIGDFVAFIPYAPDDGFPIEGGQGYIINVPKGAVIPFTGSVWTNNPPFEMAPPVQRTNAWAFVVGGWVLDGEGMSASDGEYTVTMKNLRTGAVTDETVGESGYFAAAYADLNRKAVVEAGDKVEVAVIDSRGKVVSGPFVHDVTLDSIRDAVVKVQLRLGDIIPEKSALLQNYPNPFNPETWIPFHLRSEASVSIRIFNLSGQLIRTLELGHIDAGVYVSRSKAAYWDGKNEAGEEVASGIYFYSISAGDFSATKKMIIRK